MQYKLKEKHADQRHILIKLTKTKHKERILKAAREKQQVAYKVNPICLTGDLSAESLKARREWQDIFKVLKGKNLQPRLLYPTRISFKHWIDYLISHLKQLGKKEQKQNPNQQKERNHKDLSGNK